VPLAQFCTSLQASSAACLKVEPRAKPEKLASSARLDKLRHVPRHGAPLPRSAISRNRLNASSSSRSISLNSMPIPWAPV